MRTDYKIKLIKYDERDSQYDPTTGKGKRTIKEERIIYANYTQRPDKELILDGHRDAREAGVIRSLEPIGGFDEAIILGKVFVFTGGIEHLRNSYYIKWTGNYADI